MGVLFIEGLISGILKIMDGQHCLRLHRPLTSKPLKWVEPIYAEEPRWCPKHNISHLAMLAQAQLALGHIVFGPCLIEP